MKKTIAIAVIFIGILNACTSKTVAVKDESKLDTAVLAQGAAIYNESCKKCHDLPTPTAHNAEQWVKIMDWMAPKAKLTDEQKKLVYNYVVSVKK